MTSRDPHPKTAMERVWERIKERASVYAASGSLVSMDDALAAVIVICAEESRERTPDDAIEYFARELVRLTDETRVNSEGKIRAKTG